MISAVPGAFAAAETAANERLDLTLLNGYYEERSTRCVESAGIISDKCAASVKDRLVIERIADDGARIIVRSHQENHHQCHADGFARLVDNTLQYCLDYETGTCLLITQKANKLVLQVTLKESAYVPFCGSRATLDGLEFPLESKLNPGRCGRDKSAP